MFMKTDYTVFGEFTEVGRKKAEEVIQKIEELGGVAYIDYVWWDYGGKIKWESIMAESRMEHTNGMVFQLLYPKDKEEMDNGTLSDEKFDEIVDRIFG